MIGQDISKNILEQLAGSVSGHHFYLPHIVPLFKVAPRLNLHIVQNAG